MATMWLKQAESMLAKFCEACKQGSGDLCV